MMRRYSSAAALSVPPVAVTAQIELTERDLARIASRVHPLGAQLPELDYRPPYRGLRSNPFEGGTTTRLGVTTEWKFRPDVYPCEKLSLYSWSFTDALAVDGRTFTPGITCLWHDPARLRQGKKPWSVMLLAVATEHVDRILHLCPALMVRLYNGVLAFALPAEVEL
jgi:hypothetical protein